MNKLMNKLIKPRSISKSSLESEKERLIMKANGELVEKIVNELGIEEGISSDNFDHIASSVQTDIMMIKRYKKLEEFNLRTSIEDHITEHLESEGRCTNCGSGRIMSQGQFSWDRCKNCGSLVYERGDR